MRSSILLSLLCFLPLNRRQQMGKVTWHDITQVTLREQMYSHLVKGTSDKFTAGELVSGRVVEVDKSAEAVEDNDQDIEIVIGISDLRFSPG